ncbi:MAG: glutamate-5-semialdehyde dehydrogenase [Bacteroidales bacterium]
MNLKTTLRNAAEAARTLNTIDNELVDSVLISVADDLLINQELILEENKRDLSHMHSSDARYDRLLLDHGRIRGMSDDIRNVAGLKSPLGRTISQNIRPNGLKIRRVSVPFGVVGVIYEARPNVTSDVFSLCLKSGNASVLKGGSEAVHSNSAIATLIKNALKLSGLDPNIITLLPPGRKVTKQLLNARGYVDLIIPRGSKSFIDFVRTFASVPVIETGAGICHTYFDEFGDMAKGREIINNAKTRRVSVCNALDCLIVHEKRLGDLDYLVGLCPDAGVEIYADNKAFKALKGKYPATLLHKATKDAYGTEFLSYKMAIKTVSTIGDALEHILKYGSKHSEAIISEKNERINLFLSSVDASSVYSNTSTAFTDGGEFGLGAEIGISTQKLHARGPMGLEELTTYKWIIEGNGQIRK